jgi:hypothetical protein
MRQTCQDFTAFGANRYGENHTVFSVFSPLFCFSRTGEHIFLEEDFYEEKVLYWNGRSVIGRVIILFWLRRR